MCCGRSRRTRAPVSFTDRWYVTRWRRMIRTWYFSWPVTNDMLCLEHAAGYTLPNVLTSVELVLEEIFEAKPDVYVIVAPVVDSPKVDACMLQAFAGSKPCGAPAQS